jgi:NTP pyrophosphatase (non-canonical NTP hydrolase)
LSLDREQTYATLAPMMLEEAYEAFEAVEEARAGRPQELRDELGDLLFQIVFYAQVAKERGEFTIDDVTTPFIQRWCIVIRTYLATSRPTIPRQSYSTGKP